MNKNGESYSNAIESHREIARYKRILQAQKGRVATCFGSDKISRTKRNIFDEPISNDPTSVLQPTPWRLSNIALKNKNNIQNFATKKHAKDKKILYYGFAKD